MGRHNIFKARMSIGWGTKNILRPKKRQFGDTNVQFMIDPPHYIRLQADVLLLPNSSHFHIFIAFPHLTDIDMPALNNWYKLRNMCHSIRDYISHSHNVSYNAT